jgi:hypothetical protein
MAAIAPDVPVEEITAALDLDALLHPPARPRRRTGFARSCPRERSRRSRRQVSSALEIPASTGEERAIKKRRLIGSPRALGIVQTAQPAQTARSMPSAGGVGGVGRRLSDVCRSIIGGPWMGKQGSVDG